MATVLLQDDAPHYDHLNLLKTSCHDQRGQILGASLGDSCARCSHRRMHNCALSWIEISVRWPLHTKPTNFAIHWYALLKLSEWLVVQVCTFGVPCSPSLLRAKHGGSYRLINLEDLEDECRLSRFLVNKQLGMLFEFPINHKHTMEETQWSEPDGYMQPL